MAESFNKNSMLWFGSIKHTQAISMKVALKVMPLVYFSGNDNRQKSITTLFNRKNGQPQDTLFQHSRHH